MRVLADVTEGRPRLLSRNENDATTRDPELGIVAGPGMPDDMLLDLLRLYGVDLTSAHWPSGEKPWSTSVSAASTLRCRPPMTTQS